MFCFCFAQFVSESFRSNARPTQPPSECTLFSIMFLVQEEGLLLAQEEDLLPAQEEDKEWSPEKVEDGQKTLFPRIVRGTLGCHLLSSLVPKSRFRGSGKKFFFKLQDEV